MNVNISSAKSSARKIIYVFIFVLYFGHSSYIAAQTESPFKISGYVDTYYAYDNDKSGNLVRQFSAITPVRDEFRINLAQITGKYASDRIRGIVTLQFGDIPKYNWPQSPNEYLQYIQEANAGFRIAENLWTDFGYFLTHIGAEGVIPKNNFLSSMALATYYEPFFQSGVRVSYDFSDKIYGSIYLLNGYNLLVDNNKNKSGGLQFGLKPAKNFELVFNNIFGNEQPTGSVGKTRTYYNMVLKFAPTEKLDLLLGADYAVQEKSKLTNTAAAASLLAGLLGLRFKIIPEFFIMVRGEFYEDEDGILSGLYTNSEGELTGLEASGVTFGMEYRPIDFGYVRVESRYLTADDDLKIFSDGTNPRDSRIEVLFTTGAEF